MKKLFFVSYCEKEDIEYLKGIYKKGDFLVGVDQGCQLLLEAGLFPLYLVGDFDSFTPPKSLPQKCNIIKLEKEKDFSDLEYAIKYIPIIHGSAITKHPYEIIIINNMQGRLDHVLFTLPLLNNKKKISIQSAKQKIFLIDRYYEEALPLNTIISLIPLSKKVGNITTKGLYYPLYKEILYRHNTRGLSNLSVEKIFRIEFSDGELLCVINN